MPKTKKPLSRPAILILAAGLGKRMKSPLPKVLHEICGEPMIIALLRSLVRSLGSDACEVGIVVGHGRALVEKAVVSATSSQEFSNLKITFLIQSEQKGTGHAVREAMSSAWGKKRTSEGTPILVLPGDSPLISPELIFSMMAPLSKGASLRLLTCEVPDPKGLGRIIRQGGKQSGQVLRITEEKDANPKEKLIREVAASIYLFDIKFLMSTLPKLTTKNAQGEYYLTDLVAVAAKAKKVMPLKWQNADDVRGVNDLWELALAERILQLRIVEAHARNGVRFLDPWSVVVGAGVRIGEGVIVERGVILRGKTVIGNGVEIKAGCYVVDSKIDDRAKVGPYAHFRPESVVGKDSKIGNFVELKKTIVGDGTSIAHLSYLGDAKVGARVNIGCGFVTCNFDGRTKNGSRKHETVIEDDAFIGSDCQTVAPVRVGRGAYVASGSTLTKDVEPEALAIARARQENKLGYAKKLK